MAVGVAHVALWTPDLEGSAAFWERCFGAVVGEAYRSRRRPGFVSRFATLPDGPTIELMAAPWIRADRGPDERPGWDHLALSLGSRAAVDAFAIRADGMGALAAAPRLTGDGFYEAVVRMPDGTRIEITD